MVRTHRLKPQLGLAELDPSDAFDGLTAKQHLFVMASFSGMSDVEAYRQAYDVEGMLPASVQRRAADMARHPLVRAKLKQLQREREAQATLLPMLSREFVINGITNIALAGDRDSTRLRAYELLGRVAGIDLFRDIVVTEKRTRTAEEIDQELKRRLAELAPTIEGTATEQPAEPPAKAAPRRRRTTKQGGGPAT